MANKSRTQESAEMYLETILRLSNDHPDVHSIEIAAEMGFSKPSVSVAIKNLKEQGLVTVDKYSHISLTSEGRAIAETIFERHELLTGFFEWLGVSHETAENDACRIEHVISDESFQALKACLSRHKK
ncbi:MAG: metal-dependent transcriptional regulator [Eubacteriales bacterium]|nr:metal-dependent transcriptional regulator [Eubacteriales bacterium]